MKDVVTHGDEGNEDIVFKTKIDELKADYARVSGKSCNHFYCPILFKDEEVDLCKAHIVNKAFPNSSRLCTIQRKDVDGWYGTIFEGDFVDIREVEGGDVSLTPFIADSSLSRRFDAKILVDDQPVEHFYSRTDIPEHFTKIELEGFDIPVAFGIKMHPSDFLKKINGKWEVEVSRDLNLPVQVSVIKAAHLTLFEMLGYRYALNAAGSFVGKGILGAFYQRNRMKKNKADVLLDAKSFFDEHRNMTRQVDFTSASEGTSVDRNLLACIGSSGKVWALIVFVKTSSIVHGAMVPVFDAPDSAATYLDFMQNNTSTISVSICRFEGTKWELDKEIKQIHWPKK